MKKCIALSIVCFLIFSINGKSQVWEWVKQGGNLNSNLNGYSTCQSGGVAYDNFQNLYTIGAFYDTLHLPDTLIVSKNGTTMTQNLFLAKYDQDGNRIWIRVYQGCWINTYIKQANSQIQIDPHGDLIFSGNTQSGFGGQLFSGSFVCKMTESGNIVWMQTIIRDHSFTLDQDGNIYTTFGYNGSAGVSSFGNLSIAAINSLCVGKINNAGQAVWLKQYPAGSGFNIFSSLEINPSQSELLLCTSQGSSLTLNGTSYSSAVAPGLFCRMSLTDGTIRKIITLNSSGSFFKLNHAQWISDTSFVMTGGNYTSNATYSINNVPVSSGDNTGNQHIFSAAIDTGGLVMWHHVIRGGVGEFGYLSNYSSCVAKSGNSVFVSGSVMRHANINNDTMWRNYVAIGFIARYDLNGTVQFYTVGGPGNSLVSIDHMSALPNGKLYISGNQTDWNNFELLSGQYGSVTAPSFGKYQLLFGKLEGNSNLISGRLYADLNNDGTFNGNDRPVSNAVIQLSNSGYTTSNHEGKYVVATSTGNLTITPYANIPTYYSLTPSNYTFNLSTLGNDLQNRDFRFVPSGSVQDLEINITRLGPSRRGNDCRFGITVTNRGTIQQSGTYSLTFSPQLIFIQSDSTVSQAFADSIVFQYNDLLPLDSRYNIVTFNIPPVINTGTMLPFRGQVNPIAGDQAPLNNIVYAETLVTAAYDPNAKTVLPYTDIRIDSAQAAQKFITYTLHFQNTGNDTAINVLIVDSLSALNDLSSFEMVASSHPVSLKMNGNHTLLFYFLEINLPDSNINEPKSHGFVTFRIKPLTSVTVTDTVYNNCKIYFDYNSPVLTNTVKTWFRPISVVPVQLISFQARKTSPTSGLINWVTEDESSVASYILERMAPGGRFQMLKNVQPNHSNQSIYQYTDEQPAKGINYYRLKILDRDGSFQYSPVRSLAFENLATIIIAPNPATDLLRVQLLKATPGSVYSISLFDMNGRLVLKRRIKAGTNQLSVTQNISTLAKGLYSVSLKNETDASEAYTEIVEIK